MTVFTSAVSALSGFRLAPMLAAAPPPRLPPSPYFWMPSDASTSAAHVDWLFTALMVISTVSALGIFLAMVLFLVKYRARSRTEPPPAPSSSHNTALEITWSVIPLIIVIALFYWGFKGYLDLRTAPRDAIEISVTGQKWKWLFTYPNGLTEDTLHVPVDVPVRVILSSQDVIHSLYIPAFRTKMDAVPGRYTELWFQATQVGDFPIFCAEYCGTSHSDMHATVIVHEPGGYEKWLETREQEVMNKPPAELGADLFQKQGCSTCHSTDGAPLVGPTLKGLFGHDVALADGGTVKADENYLRESIMQPQAKIVKGFNPAMPTFQGKLDDKEITGLIEFIKTLK